MMHTFQSMGNASFTLLVCWLVFLVAAFIAYRGKQKLTPYFLFAAAVCIAAAFALFSPYLHVWDEQFHALVAKNAANHPLAPKLFPYHPLHIDEQHWVNTSVWMHKQPLFTWQMALSVKIFGLSAFAVRLPSVLFHGFLVLAVFRMGTVIFNRKTGFIAAVLTMHSSFLLGLISGKVGTEHNDFIFLGYITFSAWAWLEWNLSSRRKWLYWIGIFAGCAVLTKWLAGLLIFACWTMVIIPRLEKGNWWTSFKPLLVSFGITALVAVPWQIYTFIHFPVEAAREMHYNSLHVFQALEGHTGGFGFHFEKIGTLYYRAINFLVMLAAGLVFLFLRPVRKEDRIFLVTGIVVIYGFFTFVQTKMPGFTVPVYGFSMLILAFGLTETARLIQNRFAQRLVLALLLAITVNWLFAPGRSLDQHGLRNDVHENAGRKAMLKSLDFMQSHGTDSKKRVVFGVNFFPYANISWMFFNGEIAYPYIPTPEEIAQLHREGYSTAVIWYGDSIPAGLQQTEIMHFKK